MEDPGALEALYTVIQYYNVHSCYRGEDDMKIHFSIAFEEYQCFSMVYGSPVSIAPTIKEKGILKHGNFDALALPIEILKQ